MNYIDTFFENARDIERIEAQDSICSFFDALESPCVDLTNKIRLYACKEIENFNCDDYDLFCLKLMHYAIIIKKFTMRFIDSGFYYLIDIPKIKY